jgi:phospholipid-binding lipoprotein MlaA
MELSIYLMLKLKMKKKVKDCFEGLNRATFALNQGLDKVIFEPIARVYRVLPKPLRLGAGNIINNISNLVTIPNNLLQGNLKTAGINAARLTLNSTVGVLGIFDVASSLGFKEYVKEDYGQTLGSMGVGPGCYLVLPVLGPSTIRDTLGSVINLTGGDAWYNVTVKNNSQYLTDADYYTSRLTNGIDFRAKNLDSFENLEENSIDFYASVRSLYLQDSHQEM